MREGKYVLVFENKPYITEWASVVGPKEGEGPLGAGFDMIIDDATAGKDTWEQAESDLQKTSIGILLDKAGIKDSEVDAVYAGDLLNQCGGAGFGLRGYDIPFSGVYGACSTSVLSMINAAIGVNAGMLGKAISSTSSHFCSAEKQFRFPLEYGGQRTPTSQWTVTGAASALIEAKCETSCPRIEKAILGKIIDKGVTDANNMGAAMAPDSDKIRPYPKNEGMVFFYTQIQYLRGLRGVLIVVQRHKKQRKLVDKIEHKMFKVVHKKGGN